MTALTTAATPLAPLSARCPNCGDTVPAGGRGRGRVFCRTRCRELFAARSKSEGAPILLPFLTWMETRHATPGTEAAELCREARREATAIARDLLKARAKAGMPPAREYFATLVASGERFMDRRRVNAKRTKADAENEAAEELALGDLFEDVLPAMLGHNGGPAFAAAA